MSSEETHSYSSDVKASPPAASFASEAYNPTVSDDTKMSVVGPTLVIKGELEAGENLLVEGRVEGTITHNAETLTIGGRGNVRANVKARNLIIEGTVDGDIYCSESVSIHATAKVTGNIFTPRISITEGAHFKGGIDMDVRPESATTH